MDGLTEDVMVFADEPADPQANGLEADSAASAVRPWQVLVVDDEPDVVKITRSVLHGCMFQRRPIVIIAAGSAVEARAALESHPDIAVVLLDVVMETDDAGLQLAVAIREEMKRSAVRIIMRTGQPGMAPERDVIVRYDINDYRLKTELTAQSLFTSVVAGLRGYAEIAARLRAEAEATLANRAKTDFLANIGHELRTPLNAIIGLAELMDSEAFGTLANDTYSGFIHDIVSSSKALNETLGAILDVADIEFSSMVLRCEPIEVAVLFRGVVGPMSGRAEWAGVSLTHWAPPGLMLWGDGRRLRQMLLNLISNAIRFNHKGGEVTLSADPVGRDRVMMTVLDTGVGMTGDEVTVGLTPFAQVDGGLTRQHDGVGLGLPLAKMIVDLHGGVLGISSVPGQGTVVRITLAAYLPP